MDVTTWIISGLIGLTVIWLIFLISEGIKFRRQHSPRKKR